MRRPPLCHRVFRGSEAQLAIYWKGAPSVFRERKHGTQTRQVLTPAKFRHLLRITEATSRFPERDTLILLLGVTCEMRITEIARIEVGDVLAKSGVRREEVSLRGSITKGCRPRCIYLSQRAQSMRSTAISNGATNAAQARLSIGASIAASCLARG